MYGLCGSLEVEVQVGYKSPDAFEAMDMAAGTDETPRKFRKHRSSLAEYSPAQGCEVAGLGEADAFAKVSSISQNMLRLLPHFLLPPLL